MREEINSYLPYSTIFVFYFIYKNSIYSFNLRRSGREPLWGFSDHLHIVEHFLISERKEEMWIKKSLVKCQRFKSTRSLTQLLVSLPRNIYNEIWLN